MHTYKVFYAKDAMAGYKVPNFTLCGYDEVAVIEAECLDDLFRKMNVVDGTELPLKMKIRSMSCGDVAIDETGRKFFCALVGWTEL